MPRPRPSPPPPSSPAEDAAARRFLDALARIHTWKRGGQRAPHKPLLLLLALGRIQRGEDRETDFPAIESPLRRLLEDFGPARQSYHPEFPFWHLRSDGLWIVQDADTFGRRKGGASPRVSELRDARAVGGMPEEYDALLRRSPAVLAQAAHLILDEHFEPSLHADILAAVGLDLCRRETTSRRVRDPAFAELVLRAYEYRCAVCGLDLQIDGRSMGLEAAHVRWHSHNGPSTMDNGVCMCPVHHKAFDLGAISLTDELTLVISQRVHGGGPTQRWIVDLHGQRLRGPQDGQRAPRPAHLAWHRSEVFRAPART